MHTFLTPRALQVYLPCITAAGARHDLQCTFQLPHACSSHTPQAELAASLHAVAASCIFLRRALQTCLMRV
eukprot:808457-Pelagomonas_calceolata.AAC.1